MSLDTANLNLIYDRTESDETASAAIRKSYQTLGNWSGLTDTERAQLERGTLTYNTLNRVESAVKLLAAALTSAGYPVEVEPVLKGSSRVPAGYTEVEWIQSSGTQYIDTGFKPNQETKMSLNMAFLGAAGENVAGTRNSSSDTTNRFGIVTFGSVSKIGAMFRGTATQGIPVDTATHSYTLSKSGLTVDGVSYGGADSGTFACTYPIILCGWSNGSNGIAPNKSRIVSCDIYAGGALARQFVPCKNPDGVAGLYDTVNGIFYTNQGSGAFTAGADIVGFTAGAEVGKAEDREWQEGDVLYRSQWTTYLDNVQRLRNAYYTLAETGELPAPEDKLGYVGANTIEKVLADIDLLLDGMKSIYRRAGTFSAGGNYIRQMIRSI